MVPHSVYVREHACYSKSGLLEKFGVSEEKLNIILTKLSQAKILKTLFGSAAEKDFMELLIDEVDAVEDSASDSEELYVFMYVGVVVVCDVVVKCYPKYMLSGEPSLQQMRKIFDVLSHERQDEQNLDFYTGADEQITFNPLPIILYLIYDYHEHGIYTQETDLTEINGSGQILWQKTIDESFALVSNGRHYYTEIYDRRIMDDDDGFISRLQRLILTECSEYLFDTGLLELFGLEKLVLSDDDWEMLGDKEYAQSRILQALNQEYNTRNQFLLKTMYVYISNQQVVKDENSVSLYGTSSFYHIWERLCKSVFSDRLDSRLKELPFSVSTFKDFKEDARLIDLIEHPKWLGKSFENPIEAGSTLIPDAIGIYRYDNRSYFVIFDAKYYNLTLEEPNHLSGQPGIESITKQYLYQLAYNEFVTYHGIDVVKNCFLMPMEDSDIFVKNIGSVRMNMFENLPVTPKLEPIQVRKLSADRLYNMYLNGQKADIRELEL